MSAGVGCWCAQTVAPRAVETIAAHLRKLEQEGRARMSDGAWHIIEP